MIDHLPPPPLSLSHNQILLKSEEKKSIVSGARNIDFFL